mgnify:CR=1 FL=1
MATTEFISNGVQEEIALNRVIKALQEITVHNEYESSDHALEFGEKNNVFFVKLDGAVIYAGKDGKHAVAMFYDQISKIDRDEKSDADPEFSTLREILISRNKHVKESLARLGHHALANSLDALDFAKSEFSHIYKAILLKTTLRTSICVQPLLKSLGPLLMAIKRRRMTRGLKMSLRKRKKLSSGL